MAKIKAGHKITIFVLAFLLAFGAFGGFIPAKTAHAASASVLKTTIEHFSGGSGASGKLTAAVDGKTVTVTGSITGATTRLTLDLSMDVTVIWRATLTGTTTGLDIANYRAAFLMESGEISGNSADAIIFSDSNNDGTVTIAGGTVRQEGPGQAISRKCSITVTGGTVMAREGLAIQDAGLNGSINVDGGLVFAYGSAIIGAGNVITDYQNKNKHITISPAATIIAWNKGGGAASYTLGETTDIITSQGVTAAWAVSGDECGIAYTNGGGSGFIPLAVTVVKSPVTNSGGSAALTYSGATIDLSGIGGLFAVDGNAGAREYTIETGGTGAGTLDNSILTVTAAGTFSISLVTAETETHQAGEKVTGTLTVSKGNQDSLTGLSGVDVTAHGGSDGKITGLFAGNACEYKREGGLYIPATADPSGEITGLAAGSYVVRLAGNDLYEAGPDSAAVLIGQPDAPGGAPDDNKPLSILKITATPGGPGAWLEVTAGGGKGPFTYQWQVKGSWIDIPGATTARYSYAGLEPGTTYTVRVKVTDSEGDTVISPEVTFTTPNNTPQTSGSPTRALYFLLGLGALLSAGALLIRRRCISV